MFKCFKARYFPRSHFLDAFASPNCSFVWRSITAAILILRFGCCWRVDDGSKIRVYMDKWILNHRTNGVLNQMRGVDSDWYVSDLIIQEQREWNCEVIKANFHGDDANAILRIPLIHRQTSNVIIWLHTKKGIYSVKSGYHVARQLQKINGWIETSTGSIRAHVWTKL